MGCAPDYGPVCGGEPREAGTGRQHPSFPPGLEDSSHAPGPGNRKPVGRSAWPPRACSGPFQHKDVVLWALGFLPVALGIPPAKSSGLGALGESLE